MEQITSLDSIFDPSAPTTAPAAASDPTPAPGPNQTVAEPVEPEPPAPDAVDPAAPPAAAETGDVLDPAAAPPAAPRRAPKDAPPASDDDQALPTTEKGLRAANKAERKRRQEVESKLATFEASQAERDRRFADLEQQNRQLLGYMQGLREAQQPQSRQPAPQQEVQVPDPVTDPQGALAFVRELGRRETQAALREMGSQVHMQLYETRVLHGQRAMRAQHPDYDQMEAMGTEAAARDPELHRAILAHPDPAGFIYDIGRKIDLNTKVQAAGGYDAYMQQQIDARVEAMVAQRLAAQQPAAGTTVGHPAPGAPPAAQSRTPRVPSAPPPQSLASAPSTGPRGGAQFTGPTPLDEILK